MYKVYLSKTLQNETAKKISKILPKDMFALYGDPEHRQLFPDDADIDKSSCDFVLYGADNSSLPNSYDMYEGMNQFYVNGAIIVVIRERESQNGVGPIPISWVKGRNLGRVFDLTEGVALDELPMFLEETLHLYKVQNNYLVLDKDLLPKPPYVGKEKYVFVSYEKKEDKLQAYPLIRNLQDQGYRVWYDDQENESYDPEEVADCIEQCTCLIALISPNYIESQSCKDEINLARDLNKERILVYLQKTKMSTGMAMRLLRLQAIHKYTYKTRKEFYDKLYSAKGLNAVKES